MRYDLAKDEIVFTTANTADLAAHVPAAVHEAALYWAMLSQIPPAGTTAAELGFHRYILEQVSATGANLTQAEREFFNIGLADVNGLMDAPDNFRSETAIGLATNDGINPYAPNQHDMTMFGPACERTQSRAPRERRMRVKPAPATKHFHRRRAATSARQQGPVRVSARDRNKQLSSYANA